MNLSIGRLNRNSWLNAGPRKPLHQPSITRRPVHRRRGDMKGKNLRHAAVVQRQNAIIVRHPTLFSALRQSTSSAGSHKRIIRAAGFTRRRLPTAASRCEISREIPEMISRDSAGGWRGSASSRSPAISTVSKKGSQSFEMIGLHVARRAAGDELLHRRPNQQRLRSHQE